MKIALFGKMRSGKDTVGKMLIEEEGFKRFAFATGIGQIIEEYFPEAVAEGKKPRKHYQHIGQQLRQLNEDVWINYLLKEIDEAGAGFVVVTDGRQYNEAQRLRENGFTIIKVEAPDELRIKRIEAAGDQFTPDLFTHETELQVDLIEADYTIVNDSDLKSLRDKLQITLADMFSKQQDISFYVAYYILYGERVEGEGAGLNE